MHLAVLLLAHVVLVASGAQPAPAPRFTESLKGTLLKFEMVPVPGGDVTLDAAPVKVASFFIGRTEVTWDLYDAYRLDEASPAAQAERSARSGQAAEADAITRPSQPYGAPDYNWGHNGFPVISVTRNAAEQFCKWLSQRTGRRYRLPTEAEWVRAAELAAGSNPTPSSLEPMTWHSGNAKDTTHAVATRKADALGLYDLFGNAAEWVIASSDELVTRGGSFRDPLEATGPQARAPYDVSWQERDPQLPKSRWWLSDGPFVGFRIVTSDK